MPLQPTLLPKSGILWLWYWESISAVHLLTHLDNQSGTRKHRDFWQGERQKKGLYTAVELLTKKINQSINQIMPGFLFHASKWKHCVDVELCRSQRNTSASSAQWKSWGTTADSVSTWKRWNNCSLILPMNKEKTFFNKKRFNFWPLVSSSAFGWWQRTAMKCSTELFCTTSCLLAVLETTLEHWNRASNERFLKLSFLLDAEFRLLNLPGRQTVTVTYRFSWENPVIFLCKSCAWNNLSLETGHTTSSICWVTGPDAHKHVNHGSVQFCLWSCSLNINSLSFLET